MKNYMTRQEYFKLFEGTLTPNEIIKLKIAYMIGKDAHRNVERKTGGRYFEHPRRVSLKLLSFGFTDLIYHVVAFCHDVLEDTDIELELFESIFGTEVAKTLLLLTKIEGESKTDYLKRVNRSKVAVAVKMADKLDNVLDIDETINDIKIEEWKEEGALLATHDTYFADSQPLKRALLTTCGSYNGF